MLHMSVTQQINVDCVIKVIQCNCIFSDITDSVFVMQEPFHQACNVSCF